MKQLFFMSEFLLHPDVAQFRKGVDDDAEDHVPEQNVDEEELGHFEQEVPLLHGVDVADHLDYVAHAPAVLHAEVEGLLETLDHDCAGFVHLAHLGVVLDDLLGVEEQEGQPGQCLVDHEHEQDGQRKFT
eukprot:CAMPEP_0116897068 /NCGR_PEP_ID=MMETSP0467-20121206/6162_1 /TAXON_ID=283647 /ORGANISM="Mesodinium pulex, Strain SPMC105" /LENGTH=129 /DNA_ID=CAMNT_0004568569 /DNA_START=441 /DNA_END=829 /DNA_ORIENTATION=-